MSKKKVLVTAVVLGLMFSAQVSFADPIVELAAPRMAAPKIMPDDVQSPAKKNVEQPQKASEAKPAKVDKTKIKPVKKHKKIVHKKPIIIKIDYDKLSKMIEYGYYDEADSILDKAISRNSKDVQAQSLLAISMAKQAKLDPAQDYLNCLLKKNPNNSNLHYAQGIIYYQRTTSSNMTYRNNSNNLLNSALKEFKKAIILDKNNARAYNAAGVMSLKLGNNNDAISYFKKSLNADKTYSLAIDNLGTMDFIAGKTKDAEMKFRQALVYNTQNSTAMYHLAQLDMQNQNYSSALTNLNNALYINQNSPAIYNLMGKAYVAQGNEAAAINAFKQSIAVTPEFVYSYLDLAEVYEKRGDSESAMEQLKTALSIDSGYNDAKIKLGDLSVETKKYQQAIGVYSQLVGIDNYNDSALKGLANAYYGLAQDKANKAALGSNKDLFNALNAINNAIKANPQDLELHLAKLRLSKITNQKDLSMQELNKIIKTPTTSLAGMVVKGEAYLTINDYQNAKKCFDSAIDLSANSDNDLYLAEIFIYHKQYDSAQKVLQKVLKQNPKNDEAQSGMDYVLKCNKYADNYFKSGKYFLKNGSDSTAIEYFSKSLSVNPNNAEAHLLLAKLYEKHKNYNDAVSNYKAYLGLIPNPYSAKAIQNKIKKLENKL